MTNARERKLKAQEASRVAVQKSGQRSSRVVTYFIPGEKKRVKVNAMPSHQSMGVPKGLSPQARFDMLKPDCVRPWDWLNLFTDDEELWPFIAEAAIEAVECGEFPRYERKVTNE